jgi:uncharacterized protein YecT (DUF1311 family)
MIRPLGTPLVLASLFLVPFASAQENVDCGYPLNNSERTYCAEKALKEAETAMNAAYDALQTKLTEMDEALPDHLKGSSEALSDAQEAWKVFREKDCKAYGFPFQGGTRGHELYQGCMIILTMQRTEDFNATVDDYGE